MAMVQKLFLITALGLGIQLCTSESDSKLLNFANSLDLVSSEKSEPKNIASWIRSTFYSTTQHNKDVTEQLKDIVNSDVNVAQKTQSIKQLWTQETTPKEENQGYFSSMSSYTKAAAAFIIAAGIASYFYFMRPWGNSNQ
jgi:hypothetical protein